MELERVTMPESEKIAPPAPGELTEVASGGWTKLATKEELATRRLPVARMAPPAATSSSTPLATNTEPRIWGVAAEASVQMAPPPMEGSIMPRTEERLRWLAWKVELETVRGELRL